MQTTETADRIILNPDEPASAAVIWLHGLGADGHDFVPIVAELGLPPAHRVRFIFPHAPVRSITINRGMSMRAWFDILSLEKLSHQDEAGIETSQNSVETLIGEQLAAGIPAARILLAGFSQGGAIALHTALRYPLPLAGVLALSTFLPVHETLLQQRHPANGEIPILMCHGRQDPVLPLALGEWSRDVLQAAGYPLEWQEYPMQHAVCPAEIERIGRWLKERLP